ncbi:acetyl/propionyl/methylcrotonyl-CoA carboxylase subunit alpha [Ahrensia sp. R2A130]|uniref:acetyl-CoA carboxylase biotin carboxylase subunit n=1 Tax=Ahrensia sp. R2A130 TaxID=744979 RepID=UPI0001E0BC0F|nr:acetyl/propionyl/methylcrotonyl-CoA carboxylase subunit alpha [Ahrensia sp. R2A130]EFL90162.1 methylcrotonoyl-CoA carboxylase subunit alpha [Ahrensia sp. R2A130]
MIRSLLIANRGEIACRIIATARRMGIRTIAVHSTADANARHVRLADEAFEIGGPEPKESYLRQARIIAVAREAGADAIHPGYGFLSENAKFATLVAEAGMIFVGPPPSAISAMGLKDRAKSIMDDAGVPVVPGYHGENQNPDLLRRKAYEIGYPVLIKAVAGGGGKGMRKVEKPAEFAEALSAAMREAQAAFGNDDVLVEKFIENPRHIEVQVFGDSQGNVVHLFERDCSLQRRHQKVIEEAPAPGMTPELRAAMGQAACRAAEAVGYQGAGTVEFIVSGDLGEDSFYFMEMNTRLQVEHPVTEAITGVDLVEWQLRVASGETLPKKQDALSITGHAAEARLYAEDPSTGFLPSIGKLIAADFGADDDHIRIDTGVETDDEVSAFYDPMIAKIIAHGMTRDEAMRRLAERLKQVQIAGPQTNAGFLIKLLEHEGFAAGHFDTGLIDRNLEALTAVDDNSLAFIAAAVQSMQTASKSNSPWTATDGFQLSGARETPLRVEVDGEPLDLRIRHGADGISISENEVTWSAPDPKISIARDGDITYALAAGRQVKVRPWVWSLDETGDSSSDGSVKVPMHGRILALTVSEGDEVEKGDMLFAVEAMKMEHAVVAPADGIIRDIAITKDGQAAAGQIAMRVETPTEVD